MCRQIHLRISSPSRQTSHIDSHYLSVRSRDGLQWKAIEIWIVFCFDRDGTQAGLTARGVVHDGAMRNSLAIWNALMRSFSSSGLDLGPPTYRCVLSSTLLGGALPFIWLRTPPRVPEHVPKSVVLACSSQVVRFALVRVCEG
jgi:hypothetical protein